MVGGRRPPAPLPSPWAGSLWRIKAPLCSRSKAREAFSHEKEQKQPWREMGLAGSAGGPGRGETEMALRLWL